jgi:HAD superfamily hydrolase (TIGR01549 family)
VIDAILFDIGGTLWDDYASERAGWEDMREELARCGVVMGEDELEQRVNAGIAAYAPSLTRSIIWGAVKGDRTLYDRVLIHVISSIKRRLAEDFFAYNTLFPGVAEMLESLQGRYKLAVASNNFIDARVWLRNFGLEKYFSFVGLSEEVWLFKPDTRFYQLVLDSIGAVAESTVMVGDRLDNDIFPCNRMRMATVRILSEPFSRQQPRYHGDVPRFTLDRVADLPRVLAELEENAKLG